MSDTTSIDESPPGCCMSDDRGGDRRGETYGDREKVERRVVADNSYFSALILVRNTIQVLKNGTRGSGNHAYQATKKLALSCQEEGNNTPD